MPQLRLIALTTVCVLAAASSVAAAEVQSSAELDLFERRVAAIGGQEGLLAVATLDELEALAGWLDAADVRRGYEQVVATARDPLLRSFAQYSLLRLLFETGDVSGAAALEHEMGFVTRWSLIGPFPNDGMSGMATVFAPEIGGVDDEEHEGKLLPVRWRTVDRVTETGYLALSELVAPAHAAVAYVATDFDVRTATTATLSVAIDGAYRIWLNGAPLIEQPDHLGDFFARDSFEVALQRGTNTLLVKIGSGSDHAIGLHARLLDHRGEPMLLEYRPSQTSDAVQYPESWTAPSTILERVEHELGASPTVESLARAARVVRRLMPSDPRERWRPYFDRAIAAGLTPEAAWRLAAVETDGWRREELLAIAASSTDDLVARLDWIEARYSQMGESVGAEAAEALRALLRAVPNTLRGRALWARMIDDQGFARWAFEERLALRDRAPTAPSVLFALELSIRTVYRLDLIAEIYEAILARNVTAFGLLPELSAALRAAGREEALRDHEANLLAALPLSPDAWAAVASVRRSGGDSDGALSAYARAIELAPGASELFEARGRLHLDQGARELAAHDFEEALARRPQNSDLRRYLAAITSVTDTFYSDYRLELHEIAAARRPSDAEADVPYTVLVDQKVTRVFENGLATSWIQQAFDVHTRSGADELRTLVLGYVPDSEVIEVISVRVVKSDGTTLEIYESRDQGSGSGPSSIYYDVRARSLFFQNLEAGDLLVYEYTRAEVAYLNMFDDYFGDMWFVQGAVPKRFVRYVLFVPERRVIHTNGDVPPGRWEERRVGDVQVLEYTAHDVPMAPRDAGAPGRSERMAYIGASTYDDWDALADWYWNLIKDQLVASPEIIAAVESLTAGLSDRREIAAAIYGYVVRNTRYVGLEFGIHGFKPYRTSDCFNRRFGDCKDTASLMKVMLEIAGIDSHIVLVRTRDVGRVADFPPSLALFNHAITYIPELDLYLDGTAAFSGSSELPTADQGASAVIVEDGRGGTFLTIPTLPAAASVLRVETEVDLRVEPAVGRGTRSLSGSFAPSARATFENAQGRVERVEQDLARDVPGVRVVGVEVDGTDDIESPVTIRFSTEGGAWVRRQGDGWIVAPVGSTTDIASRYSGAATRSSPVELQHAFRYESRHRVVLPDSLVPTAIGEPEQVESEFGTLSVATTLSDGVLQTDVVFEIARVRIELDEFQAFRAFIQQCASALDRVVRLVEVAS